MPIQSGTAGARCSLALRMSGSKRSSVRRKSNGDAAAHGLHERGLVPESVLVRRSTLEDVFLHLTGRSLIE